jgi:DNA-binding CsgD family transcriptional regulator
VTLETGPDGSTVGAMDTPVQGRSRGPLWRLPLPGEVESDEAQRTLRERVKELNCLYMVSQLAERNMYSIDDLLSELVEFLPHSWQYPDVACAKILFKGNSYTSAGFRATNWRQSARIYEYHEAVGECSIFYLEEREPADEGPFLKEERALLDGVAEQIGLIATRIFADLELQEMNRQLALERAALQESNAALRAVLARIEQEKQEIRKDIRTNVDRIVIPLLHALALQLTPSQQKYAELLQTNLEDIASPFTNRLSQSYLAMTPTELSICNMVRNGLKTREIAELRGISEATVNHHREKIRRKLKLTNADINLATFLHVGAWQDQHHASGHSRTGAD